MLSTQTRTLSMTQREHDVDERTARVGPIASMLLVAGNMSPSFLREVNPAADRSWTECKPFFHHSARPRLEASADSVLNELVDASLRQLHHELVARGNHGEDFAPDLEGSRAKAFPRFSGNLRIMGESLHNGREPLVDRSHCLTFSTGVNAARRLRASATRG
jgi:hypothetical protein